MAQNTHQLLIHLPENLRTSFKDACENQRVSMSEVLRDYMQQYIESAK